MTPETTYIHAVSGKGKLIDYGFECIEVIDDTGHMYVIFTDDGKFIRVRKQ